MGKKKSFREKAGEVISDVLKYTMGTGTAAQTRSKLDERVNELDEINRQLENTSPNTTPDIEDIFRK